MSQGKLGTWLFSQLVEAVGRHDAMQHVYNHASILIRLCLTASRRAKKGPAGFVETVEAFHMIVGC